MTDPTPQQRLEAEVGRHNKLVRMSDTMNLLQWYRACLDVMPLGVDFVSDAEILLLIEIAEYYRVDWTRGLEPPERRQGTRDLVLVEVNHGHQGAGELPALIIDTRKFWAWDDSKAAHQRTRRQVRVRVRASHDVLNHHSHEGPTWLPAFDIVLARQLIGQLKRHCSRDLQAVMEDFS